MASRFPVWPSLVYIHRVNEKSAQNYIQRLSSGGDEERNQEKQGRQFFKKMKMSSLSENCCRYHYFELNIVPALLQVCQSHFSSLPPIPLFLALSLFSFLSTFHNYIPGASCLSFLSS
uniref:Uncharacterized protein n=1 Tax=Cacopsylla melanoneura TaxID=428564 RepID=A0A8D8ZAV9_9HEMI